MKYGSHYEDSLLGINELSFEWSTYYNSYKRVQEKDWIETDFRCSEGIIMTGNLSRLATTFNIRGAEDLTKFSAKRFPKVPCSLSRRRSCHNFFRMNFPASFWGSASPPPFKRLVEDQHCRASAVHAALNRDHLLLSKWGQMQRGLNLHGSGLVIVCKAKSH